MRKAHEVDVRDLGSSTRRAVRSDENNDRLGVQTRQSLSVRGHRQRDTKALVHGDDFVSSGERAELEWLCKGLGKKFETKMTMVEEDSDVAQGGKSAEPNCEMAPVKRGSPMRPIPGTQK